MQPTLHYERSCQVLTIEKNGDLDVGDDDDVADVDDGDDDADI